MRSLFIVVFFIATSSPALACGWFLMSPASSEKEILSMSADQLLLQDRAVMDADYLRKWMHSKSFDTARECEAFIKEKTDQLRANYWDYQKKIKTEQEYVAHRAAYALNGWNGKCIPADYLKKLPDRRGGQPDFRYDPDTGKLIPLK
mgnify:CR=1 FL=1